ncbi:MAG: hypothetical protein IID15_01140 [Candidatus Marinimicrobia bacterium]|nr:hypothetical protein [Candidatus Neomarinimicrobiota bacterium]
MRTRYLTLALLALTCVASAQREPYADRQILPVAVEFATFRASGGLTTLEVYLEIPSPEEIYAIYGPRYIKELATAVLLKHRGQIVAFADATLRDETVTSRRSAATGDAITSTALLTARPGEYELQVVVEDRAGIAFDQTFAVTIPAYSYNSLDLSDLVLARAVGWASKVAATSRLGLDVTPAVPPVFKQNRAWIWYMLELYGLSPEDTVIFSTSIVSDSGTVVEPQPWQIPVPANTLAQRGVLLFENAPPGDYRFVVEVVAAGDSATQVAHFTIADSLAPDDTLSALAGLSKRDLKKLAADFSQVWRRFNDRGFASLESHEQHSRIAGITDGMDSGSAMDSVSVGDLIDRWQMVRLLDAGRTRRMGLSAGARLVLSHGLPQAVRIAPATFSQSESQLWIYGDDGPIYFLVDIDGNGTFGEVDGEQIPLFLLQSLAAIVIDSVSVMDSLSVIDSVAVIDSVSVAVDSLVVTAIDSVAVIDSVSAAEEPPPAVMDTSAATLIDSVSVIDKVSVIDSASAAGELLPAIVDSSAAIDSLQAPAAADSTLAPADSAASSMQN